MSASNEPLVDVTKHCPGIKVQLDKRRMKVEKTALVRLTVAKKLHQAQKLLPRGMNFIIRDAWRPAYIQAGIYYDFVSKAKKRFPGHSEKETLAKINKFVAPWKGDNVSGHMTGGAVDIRLIGKNGKRIPMISRKLAYVENSQPIQLKLPKYIQANRKIMADALTRVGFYNNSAEYWHWSYGDFYWAKYTGNRVIYGRADKKGIYDNKMCPCGSGKKFINCCY